MSWLNELKGKRLVVKFGGNAMTSSDLVATFAKDVAMLRKCGVDVVVVHGGGPQISAALTAAGLESEFVDGLRVTSKNAVAIIRDVLMEQISMPLAALIEKEGAKTAVLNGVTEDLLLAEITRPDLGQVGEVFAVRDGYLTKLLESEVIPVISTVAPAEDGQLVNVNADLASASIASAIGATELLILTDVDGLYLNWPDKDSLTHSISSTGLEALLPSLESGMVPKVDACLAAIYGGVRQARIINGSLDHAIEKLGKSEQDYGTKVTA